MMKLAVVNLLILLAIVLSVSTTVLCQQESPINSADQAENDGSTAVTNPAGADDVKDEPSARTTSSENIVAIHVDAVGAKEQLRPGLRGLSYIASSFLPRDYTLIEVLAATREVVAGVRYDIIVKAFDQNQQEVVCALVVLEKPWLTTESGDKYRLLENGNCTSSEEQTSTDGIEIVTQLNPIFDPSLRDRQEMNPSRFKDLVNQIIIEKHEVREVTPEVYASSTTEEPAAPELSESSKNVLDQLFLFGNEAQSERRVSTTDNDNRRQEATEEVIIPKRIEPNFVQTTTAEPPSRAINMTIDEQVKSTFEEVFKTHQEIQKALDEVIQSGGGRDVQQKYEPVFASLLQKVKISIDNYYRMTNPGGGEANFDTAAFVVRDNNAQLNTIRQPPSKPATENPSTSEEDDDQQQQAVQPDFDFLTTARVESPTMELTPPRIDSVTMNFSDTDESDSREQQQQQQQPLRPLTKEELTAQLNADESSQQQRDKRSTRSHDHDIYHSPFQPETSGESHEHHDQPYYAAPGSLPGKRFTEFNLDSDPKDMHLVEKIIAEAIVTLDRMDADLFKRIPLEIVSVKRINNQFSSEIEQKGELWVARVVLANSHCIEETEDIDKCQRLLIDGSSKFCTLEIRVKHPDVRLVKSECVGSKSMPGLVGGHRELDVSEPEHQQRIKAGLKTYGKGKYKSSKFIIRCGTVQVVAGTIHRYTVDLLGKGDKVTKSCQVKVYTPVSDQAEYKFDCNEPPTLSSSSEGRQKRDVERKKMNKAPKVGAPSELTPEEYNKPEHSDRIRDILVGSSGGNSGDRKYTIVSATKKTVAGILYTYKLTFSDDPDKRVCTLTSHERPWLKEKNPTEAQKVSFSCPEATNSRVKRGFCAGCPVNVEPSELETEENKLRISKILTRTSTAHEGEPKILSASKQIVEGTKYKFVVAFNVDGVERKCNLTSWERPWRSDPKDAYRYSAICDGQDEVSHSRKRRGLLGGPNKLSEDELRSDEHTTRLNQIIVSFGGETLESPKIVEGTKQVVAGSLYKYKLSYPIQGESKTCWFTSWEQPWLEDKKPDEAYQYSVECDGAKITSLKKRSRRSSKKTGASFDISPENLKDQSHIDRIKAGLVGYNQEKSRTYEDFEIIKGSVQPVAGSLYKYTFKVKGEPSVVCKISVWERIWLETQDQRKYNVKCEGDDEPEQEHQQSAVSTSANGDDNLKRAARSVRPLRGNPEEDGYYTKGEEHARAQFEKFKQRHSRDYPSSLEHEMRFRIFKNNLFKIEQLNKYEQGTAKYGITHFADMTSTEYKLRTGLVVPREADRNHISNPMAEIDESIELPEAFDWRDLGAVSPVKNQGNCGSCWAFSVVGNIEGLHQVKTKTMEEYSEQELLDCDTTDNACQGGFMDDAYKAIEKIGGLELESEYPYLAKKQKTCHFNQSMVHVRVKGAVDLPKNETAIAQFLIANGPVSIGLNANAMQFYRGGISHPWRPLCSKKNLDHGVLIVGFGIKEYPMFNKTLPYWIVKNSWGPKWGEQGYYRVFRGDNTCGVAEMATSAVLE
ncbi:uncharacterized protein LOC129738585 isoform X2 [Uranotaenia lowii]|uniref:uncharacterized protein LOC129738585 isoform X2 n=1 Tax=Uranotaenia lowii TaxID=190385 RepID=UPI002479EC26|nr:uncharacterized protein LOC129738585 isoform X2 [Uranotaenia lowii]